MKTMLVRGVPCRVGTIIQPSPEALAALAQRGQFHELFGDSLPTPPTSLDLVTPCAAAIATMLGNGPDPTLPTGVGPVGDCVIAEDLHLAAMRATLAGAPWQPTTAQALDVYSAVTGFDPANQDATDNGTDPMALVRYRETGAPYPDGSTLLMAINVDATNKANVQRAIWLADGVFQWASLPNGVESEEDSGDVWDVCGDPNPENGHGFGAGSYDDGAVGLIEWGMVPPIRATYDFLATYCKPSAGGGMIAMLGNNAFSRITGLCPAGFSLDVLEARLGSVGRAM